MVCHENMAAGCVCVYDFLMVRFKPPILVLLSASLLALIYANLHHRGQDIRAQHPGTRPPTPHGPSWLLPLLSSYIDSFAAVPLMSGENEVPGLILKFSKNDKLIIFKSSSFTSSHMLGLAAHMRLLA